MSNLETIRNYQLKGMAARRVEAIFGEIKQNQAVAQQIIQNLGYAQIAQKYPQITETTLGIEELTKLSTNTTDPVEKIVYSLSLITKTVEKINKNLVHGKKDSQKQKELDELNTRYEQLYNKLTIFDVDLYQQIQAKMAGAIEQSKKVTRENYKLEEEVLELVCGMFELKLDGLTIQEMTQLLANVEKSNVWGFDFFTLKLEALNNLQKPKLATTK